MHTQVIAAGLLVLGVCLLPLSASGQQSILDSLRTELKGTSNDSIRVRILGDLAYYSYSTNPDSSYHYANRTYELAHSNDYLRGMFNGKYKMAFARLGQGKFEDALIQAQEGIEISHTMHDTFRLTAILNLLGVIQTKIGDSQAAIESLFQSAQLGEQTGDSINAAYAYNNIGDIYEGGLDDANAYKFYKKAMVIWQSLNDTFELVTIYNNIGGVAPDSTERLVHLEEAVRLGEVIGFNAGLSYAYKRLGSFQWHTQNDLESAERNYELALLASRQTEEQFALINNMIDLSALKITLGKFEEARSLLNESIPLCQSYGLPNELQTATNYMSQVHQATGNHNAAYQNLRKAYVIRDSLYSENLAQSITEANARYELGQKEAEIAKQELEITKQRNARNRNLFGGILALLLATGVYQWYYYRQRKKQSDLVIAFNKKIATAETQALRAQMNPHFIFNALNSIKLFVLKRSPEKGGVYLDAFARLVRSVLQNSKEPLISLERELEALDLYIGLEKLRFDEAFDHVITVDEDLDWSFYQVPPLILQPYVENAIWHGMMSSPRKGKLLIDARLSDEKMLITIEDNGVGRLQSAQSKNASAPYKKSMGMEITKGRMELQKELVGMEINVNIHDLIDERGAGMGTKVTLEVDYG